MSYTARASIELFDATGYYPFDDKEAMSLLATSASKATSFRSSVRPADDIVMRTKQSVCAKQKRTMVSRYCRRPFESSALYKCSLCCELKTKRKFPSWFWIPLYPEECISHLFQSAPRPCKACLKDAVTSQFHYGRLMSVGCPVCSRPWERRAVGRYLSSTDYHHYCNALRYVSRQGQSRQP